MRLVIATPLYPPEIGGPATYAKLLAGALPAKGIEVELVKFSDVRHFPKLIRHYIYYRRVCAALQHADVVLALDPVSVGFPAMRAAKKMRKPFLVKIVGDYAWEQGRHRFGVTENLDEFVKRKQPSLQVRVLQRIQIRVALRASRIIVPSNYLKTIVMAWGIPSENIQVIYNAVHIEDLGLVPENVTQLPRPLVVTAGRFVPWKHIDGVIDAVASIPQASLAVIGDGPLQASLTRYAHTKLPGRSVFTGMLSHQDALATIHSADVFVLNSSYEGLSHFLIEALSVGVPIIATRVGGNTEVITDESNGLLIDSGDSKLLAATLSRVFADTALQGRLRREATESAKRFSEETMLASTTQLLQTL
jgi:glycosyltransferase involved in cell wall biosynthesis